MLIDTCIKQVNIKFPFPNYIDDKFYNVVYNISKTIRKYIEPGAKILDFGSGPCDKTAVIQCLGYQCFAFDDLLDNWHRESNNLEKILGFANEFNIEFKLAERDGYLPFPTDYFDMIMLHDVLEHLHSSPRGLLNDLCKLLKADGLLFVTVPNAVNIRKRISVLKGETNLPPYEAYYWYPGEWRGHVREYVKNDLVLLSYYLGLQTLELTSCHHMIHLVPSLVRPAFSALTKMFPGWRDTWLLIARKPYNWTPQVREYHASFINQ